MVEVGDGIVVAGDSVVRFGCCDVEELQELEAATLAEVGQSLRWAASVLGRSSDVRPGATERCDHLACVLFFLRCDGPLYVQFGGLYH